MTGHFCSACGTLNPPAARFCKACGARLPHASGNACSTCGTPALPGNRYCDACGSRLPACALFVVEDTGWRVMLPDRPDSVVGREDPLSGTQPDVDLAPHNAEASGVSRRHARLIRSHNATLIEDLGSVNLTYVNDQRLEPGRPVALKDGDRIALGNLRLIFRQA